MRHWSPPFSCVEQTSTIANLGSVVAVRKGIRLRRSAQESHSCYAPVVGEGARAVRMAQSQTLFPRGGRTREAGDGGFFLTDGKSSPTDPFGATSPSGEDLRLS